MLRADALAHSLLIRRIECHQHRRLAELLHQPRGDDADHPGVPALAGQHDRAVVVAVHAAIDHHLPRKGGDLLFDGLPLLVLLFEVGGDLHRPGCVALVKHLDAQAGVAQAGRRRSVAAPASSPHDRSAASGRSASPPSAARRCRCSWNWPGPAGRTWPGRGSRPAAARRRRWSPEPPGWSHPAGSRGIPALTREPGAEPLGDRPGQLERHARPRQVRAGVVADQRVDEHVRARQVGRAGSGGRSGSPWPLDPWRPGSVRRP